MIESALAAAPPFKKVKQPLVFIHIEQDRNVRDPYRDDWQNIDQYPFHNAPTFGLKKVIPGVP